MRVLIGLDWMEVLIDDVAMYGRELIG